MGLNFGALSNATKRMALLLPMAMAVGSASAFFLWSLDAVTRLRFTHPWLLFLLPLGGFLIGGIYWKIGGSVSTGQNLLIDEIHEPGAGIPRRMAPLILLGTLLTHLFGGSAGREGTALQMGGGIAGTFGRWFRADAATLRILLMAGVAAGFGSVFGTPVAGAVFAIEVLVIGRMQYDALIPCFVASLAAHWTCHAWGAEHTVYEVTTAPEVFVPELALLAKAALAAVAFGGIAAVFVGASHQLLGLMAKWVPFPPLRPALGGMAIVALVFLAGSRDFLGLGILPENAQSITLPRMFTGAEVPGSAWLWKLVFTLVTVASGFKGGEVTPLFFIGAALGNSLAWVLGAPVDLFAALGFIAVFAGATNTPLASTILGVELFGGGNVVYFAAACIIAYRFSGSKGLYASQRPGVAKSGH